MENEIKKDKHIQIESLKSLDTVKRRIGIFPLYLDALRRLNQSLSQDFLQKGFLGGRDLLRRLFCIRLSISSF